MRSTVLTRPTQLNKDKIQTMSFFVMLPFGSNCFTKATKSARDSAGCKVGVGLGVKVGVGVGIGIGVGVGEGEGRRVRVRK